MLKGRVEACGWGFFHMFWFRTLVTLCIISDFFLEAKDNYWGKILVAAMWDDEARKQREMVYVKDIARCSEDEIDAIQKYFMSTIPEYICDTLPPDNQYRSLNVVANDLGM